MRLLLDTHVFLWFISADPRIQPTHRDAIRDLDNEVYLSVVSLWEATIKHQLGKLPLPESPARYLPHQRQVHQIMPLPLDEASVMQLPKLPDLHRDPFDRMLVCQALAHELMLVTVDNALLNYPVPILDF